MIYSDSPAFPQPMAAMTDGSMYTTIEKSVTLSGLTIRAEFAKSAMQGMLANPRYDDWSNALIAHDAVSKADALIAELNKKESV